MLPDISRKCADLFFTTKRSGSGMGLALCKRAVSDFGGELDIESTPGVGTNVSIRLLFKSSTTPARPTGDHQGSLSQPMSHVTLFQSTEHRNILLEDFSTGDSVQANQHLIVHGRQSMLLDPGGHKVYSKVFSATTEVSAGASLRYVFLSHQDPDVVAAVNGWLMATDAEGYISKLWTRFIPHFGLDRLVHERLKPIPDSGMRLSLGGAELKVIPAHFLHSPGNFQVYDPVSKILYTGDLGASIGAPYREVNDFDHHLQFMESFHRRYMGGNRVMRAWAKVVRNLEIDLIAPQHGAVFRGTETVNRFISWCEELECGVDLADQLFRTDQAH